MISLIKGLVSTALIVGVFGAGGYAGWQARDIADPFMETGEKAGQVKSAVMFWGNGDE